MAYINWDLEEKQIQLHSCKDFIWYESRPFESSVTPDTNYSTCSEKTTPLADLLTTFIVVMLPLWSIKEYIVCVWNLLCDG